jgi:hypothetical protein
LKKTSPLWILIIINVRSLALQQLHNQGDQIGRIFTYCFLRAVFLIIRVTLISGMISSTVKMGSVTFWAIFSHTHLITLCSIQIDSEHTGLAQIRLVITGVLILCRRTTRKKLFWLMVRIITSWKSYLFTRINFLMSSTVGRFRGLPRYMPTSQQW